LTSLQKKSFRILNKPNIISTVHVSLEKRTYPIYIGSGLLRKCGELFAKHRISKTIILISDTLVARLYLQEVLRSLTKQGFKVYTIIIPRGEQQKSLSRADKIFTQLLRWKTERNCTVAALGGGVVGDLAGFIAATYQRGVGFVQIPTTLLAQVDSSVGGKVGINHPLAKNMIGAFYQPQIVIADVDVLKTLPKREIVCGLGEIVKYGIILDKKFFNFTREHYHDALQYAPEIFSHMVKRSCEMKAYVVSYDEREQNLRAILNFGHTIGHAFEHAGGYSNLKHGEAILYGMVAETAIAHAMKKIPLEDKMRIEEMISSIPLPKLSSLKLTTAALIPTMQRDKKVKDGNIRMVLPLAIGKVSLPQTVDMNLISSAINYTREYASLR